MDGWDGMRGGRTCEGFVRDTRRFAGKGMGGYSLVIGHPTIVFKLGQISRHRLTIGEWEGEMIDEERQRSTYEKQMGCRRTCGHKMGDIGRHMQHGALGGGVGGERGSKEQGGSSGER